MKLGYMPNALKSSVFKKWSYFLRYSWSETQYEPLFPAKGNCQFN